MKKRAAAMVLIALADIAIATGPDLQVSPAAARSTTAGPQENFVGRVEVERLYTPPASPTTNGHRWGR